jgi:oxygen-dependent protoporphyrinogen oxidase
VNTTAAPLASTSPRIAVIGGGITGLAAAHRISELLPDAELSLFEAAPRLGGVLETIQLDGFLIERSADSFLTRLHAAIDLCRRLGIELVSTEETRRRAFVVRAGRLMPVPDGFFLMSPRKLRPILTSPILSPLGKLRLLAEPFIRAPVPSPQSPASDESIASFARRRLGRETFERLVQPLVGGIYTGDPEKLSMAATMPEFFAAERNDGSLLRPAVPWTGHLSDQSETASGARYALFVAPEQGTSALIDALSARLPPRSIQLNTRVTAIDQTADGRWKLDCGLKTHSPNPQSAIRNPQSSFDAIIFAIPAYAASELLESLSAPLAAELAAIEYAGCVVVSLGFDRQQIADPLDGFGFVVPQIENRRIIAASFASQKFRGRAPHDTVLIRTFVGGALQPELLDLPDAELSQLAIDELRELLHISGEPRVVDIARWPRSMPQYHVGHLQRVAHIEHLVARHPTLALAGNAYHGVGIPQCIASGEAAAERIAATPAFERH